MARPASDPAQDGLVPVGWYHTHTRSGHDLSEQDLEICARYFPEAWQVALLVCPERMGPTRGVFHVQPEDGSPRAEAEFVLEPQTAPRRTPPAPPASIEEDPRVRELTRQVQDLKGALEDERKRSAEQKR